MPAGSPRPHRIHPGYAGLSVRDKDEKDGQWPTVGSPTEPGTPAAEHLGFAGEVPRLARRAESLAREVPRLARKALSFACKLKSLAAGAPRFDRDAFGPGETGSMLGGGGHGPDLGLAGEAGGHSPACRRYLSDRSRWVISSHHGRRDARNGSRPGFPPYARYPAAFASDNGILGLIGLTETFCRDGSMMRSISSIGIAPSSTWLPNTKAPVTHSRPKSETRTGAT